MNKEYQQLVSICMPAYNVENVLEAALRSVLTQTYQRIEVILIDDASTDNTHKVAQSISDERIKYFRNKTNLGGYQTMNKAISLSTGDLIAVYHSDDVYEPTIVEKEVAYLRANKEVGAVFCLAYLMNDEGSLFGRYTIPHEFRNRKSLTYEEIFPFFLRNKNILLCCPSFMTRRKVLEIVGPFDAEKYDIAADLDMWIRIARRFPIGILNEVLMRYRSGKRRWSKRYNNFRTDQELYFNIMDFYLEKDGWFQKLKNTDLVEYQFHQCDDETFRATNLIIHGDIHKALELLHRPYPYHTLLINLKRRKLRVLLLRVFIRCGITIGLVRPLSRFLKWLEYGGKFS